MRSFDEPHVGIFWFFNCRLLTDCTPLSGAEAYGDCQAHPRGHLDVWTEMQSRGLVPLDVEYEDPPRGRIMFDKRRDRFLLLADPCILRRRSLVKQIVSRLHLPPERTEMDRDAHYRCAECLARSRQREL